MINFGIVGCGHISRKHASALKDIPATRLVAVCDVDCQRMLPMVREYDAVPYTDYYQFLGHPGLDAVIICIPSGLHASMAEEAAAAGKHVLVEKPLVLNVQDGKRLLEICRAKGVKLGVVHPNRAKHAVRALKEALGRGWFGKITHADAVLRWNRNPEYFRSAPWRGTRKLDGGILFNQAIHNIDLFTWLLGPAEEVFAYGATRVHDIQCEDVCVCVLKMGSGALGVIEAAVTVYPQNLEESIAIFGSHGTAVLGGRTLSEVREWRFSCLSLEESAQQVDSLNSTPDSPGHLAILRDFVSAIAYNREPMVTGDQALKTLCLIRAIYQSMERGRPVQVRYD
ncbi:MAG: Gfo/Idh/MocA family oxidoreductase [Clostridia bacterium]|nr:Gfo/Idh/MocA family oxidoreductase [Clostridia bacterium]